MVNRIDGVLPPAAALHPLARVGTPRGQTPPGDGMKEPGPPPPQGSIRAPWHRPHGRTFVSVAAAVRAAVAAAVLTWAGAVRAGSGRSAVAGTSLAGTAVEALWTAALRTAVG